MKAPKRSTRSAPSSLWEEFARRHRGNRFLNVNPLYALHEELLDIIAGKPTAKDRLERTGVAPSFLSKEDIAFERDLARTVSGGFFHGKPFFLRLPGEPPDPAHQANPPAVPPPPRRVKEARRKKRDDVSPDYDKPPDESLFEQRAEANAFAKVRDLRAYLLDLAGLKRPQLEDHFARESRYEELTDLRAAAYVGWLMMHHQFRHERDVLRSHCGKLVERLKGFPAVPGAGLESVTPRVRSVRDHDLFMEFYGRWGLETLLTWDLPLPMRASLFAHTDYDPSLSGKAGMNVFIPWYMFRDGQLDLMELVKHLQKSQNINHLGGWMKTAAAARGELGDVRLRNALVLYRYQNLALQSRYPERAGWEKEKQDSAFARFLVVPTNDFDAAEKKMESIRQVRMYLQKHLSP